MAYSPKWTIEIQEEDGNFKTYARRGANAISGGTSLTVPGGDNPTTRLHEAIIKGVLAALNDRAVNG